MKAFLITFAIFVMGLLACFSYFVWSFYYGVEAERTPFIPEVWRGQANVYEDDADPGCVRGGMALDIVAANLLQEKSVSEVEYLLGKPDGSKDQYIFYELGQCSGFGWHNSVLQVSFLNNQLVTNAAILRQDP